MTKRSMSSLLKVATGYPSTAIRKKTLNATSTTNAQTQPSSPPAGGLMCTARSSAIPCVGAAILPSRKVFRHVSGSSVKWGSTMDNYGFSTTVYITDGVFRVTERQYLDNQKQRYIEHWCKLSWKDFPRWDVWIMDPQYRGSRCSYCGKHPADGIQAMFWFMEEDSTC